MTYHAFSISYLLDFVVLTITLLENNLLATWVFLVVSLGVVWLCSARVELSSPNMVKLGNGTPYSSLSLNISTSRGSVNKSQLLEVKNKHYNLPYRWNSNNDINPVYEYLLLHRGSWL